MLNLKDGEKIYEGEGTKYKSRTCAALSNLIGVEQRLVKFNHISAIP
jgi:hypothetical protein